MELKKSLETWEEKWLYSVLLQPTGYCVGVMVCELKCFAILGIFYKNQMENVKNFLYYFCFK